MRLENITAVPHPQGNRIDLRWNNPTPAEYPGIRVVRRESTYPVSPDDGVLVAEGSALLFSMDLSLQNDLDSGTLLLHCDRNSWGIRLSCLMRLPWP